MNSIMPMNFKTACYICGATCKTEEHHIFEGSNRKMSEEYGLKINVCRVCHRNIHREPKHFEWLKEQAQITAMTYHHNMSLDEWRHKFRKNYRSDIE